MGGGGGGGHTEAAFDGLDGSTGCIGMRAFTSAALRTELFAQLLLAFTFIIYPGRHICQGMPDNYDTIMSPGAYKVTSYSGGCPTSLHVKQASRLMQGTTYFRLHC